MSNSTTDISSYDAQALPKVVVQYLETHSAKQHGVSETLLAPDATIVDNGTTFDSAKKFTDFLESFDKEYTFTIEWTGQNIKDATTIEVLSHMEGNFPGGKADLWYRFSVDGDRIRQLIIEP